MRGKPQFNFPEFYKAAKTLRKRGHIVFNPAANDILKYGVRIQNNATGSLKQAIRQCRFSARQAFAADTRWICLFADAIFFLKGWRRSLGARAEYALAKALGLKIIYEH